MATSNVITLRPGRDRGEPLSQIHTQLMACHEAIHCATLTLGQVEASGDRANFGPALRVIERSAAQLDKLVDRLDEWQVRHYRALLADA